MDWKDDTTFASCSTDKRVLICRVGVDHPLRVYTGHLDEVNAVKWDPSGTLLASCSDDFTAKVWNVASDRSEPMYDFKDHKAEIYTLKWYVYYILFVFPLCFIRQLVSSVRFSHSANVGVQRVQDQ